jgi:hypothetical protein
MIELGAQRVEGVAGDVGQIFGEGESQFDLMQLCHAIDVYINDTTVGLLLIKAAPAVSNSATCFFARKSRRFAL